MTRINNNLNAGYPPPPTNNQTQGPGHPQFTQMHGGPQGLPGRNQMPMPNTQQQFVPRQPFQMPHMPMPQMHMPQMHMPQMPQQQFNQPMRMTMPDPSNYLPTAPRHQPNQPVIVQRQQAEVVQQQAAPLHTGAPAKQPRRNSAQKLQTPPKQQAAEQPDAQATKSDFKEFGSWVLTSAGKHIKKKFKKTMQNIEKNLSQKSHKHQTKVGSSGGSN